MKKALSGSVRWASGMRKAMSMLRLSSDLVAKGTTAVITNRGSEIEYMEAGIIDVSNFPDFIRISPDRSSKGVS